ncbi:MAG: ion channel [Acidobacteriota bacterium]
MDATDQDPAVAERAAAAAAREHRVHRELGFGSVVARHGERLLNRDGTFNVRRSGYPWWRGASPYHWLLDLRWRSFFAVCGVAFLAINLVFALAYLACGPDGLRGEMHELGDGYGSEIGRAFFFSVQTLSTVGYGGVRPSGWWTNVIMTVESLVGLTFVALTTGLIFARFALARPKLRFSDRAVIGPLGDHRALMFRLTHLGRSEVITLEVRVILAVFEKHPDGHRERVFIPLPLERSRVSFLPLAWTIVHPIDAASPLAQRSREELEGEDAELLVVLSAVDRTSGQPVYERTSYRFDEVVWNARFVSLYDDTAHDSTLAIDVSRLHDVEPVA